MIEEVQLLAPVPGGAEGMKILFKPGVTIRISMMAHVAKVNDPSLSSVKNLFSLLADAQMWNLLFGMNQLDHIGFDISNAAGQVFTIPDGQMLAGSEINLSGFTPAALTIYFLKKNGTGYSFKKPSIIVRILGFFISTYIGLILMNYQDEQAVGTIILRKNNGVIAAVVAFGLGEFVEGYFDILENVEVESAESLLQRRLFLVQVLRNEYDFTRSNAIHLDASVDTMYTTRLMANIDFISSYTNNQIQNNFEQYVANKPDRQICIQLRDIHRTTLVIFDGELYQFDLIDLVTPNVLFSRLAKRNDLAHNCKAIINGPYWELPDGFNSAVGENVIGLFNKVPSVERTKGIPRGHSIFRSGQEWVPGANLTDINGNNSEVQVLASTPGRYYFYQNQTGDLVFERGSLPADPALHIAVGCDNMLAFLIDNGGFVLDADTDDFVRPASEADRANFTVRSSNPQYTIEAGEFGNNKGFPFFGYIEKSGKKYLYVLVAEDMGLFDDSFDQRPRQALDLLKNLGAKKIYFTDGGTSAKLIYNNTLLTSNDGRASNKDSLIATAIGIQPKSNIADKIILDRRIAIGTTASVIENINDAVLTAQEKDAFMQRLAATSPIPFVESLTHERFFTYHFGFQTIAGVRTFVEGIGLRAQTPLDVLINIPGKVFATGVGYGFGNYVIIRHGKDNLNNSYYTLYADLSAVSVVAGQSIARHGIIGKTGQSSGMGTGPHLHFELMRTTDDASVTTYESLLPRAVHINPEDYYLPENLIV